MYLTNEQRFAIAMKMLAVVERLTFGKDQERPATSTPAPQPTSSNLLSDEQEAALSAIVKQYVTVAPEASEAQDE